MAPQTTPVDSYQSRFPTNLAIAGPGYFMVRDLSLNITLVTRRGDFVADEVRTTNQTDLAIRGAGFFTVRDPSTDVFYATRHGAFHLDRLSRLVDCRGFCVQGLVDTALTRVGDVVIDAAGAPSPTDPGAVVTWFVINSDGCVYVDLSDRTCFIRAQILLQNYRDLQALHPEGDELYSNVDAAQPVAAAAQGFAGTIGLGWVEQSMIEIPWTQPTLELPPRTGFRLYISKLAGTATVEASTDLQNWTGLGRVTGSIMEDAEFFDTDTAGASARFYRVQLD
jgi:flagellar hook protein FlgE